MPNYGLPLFFLAIVLLMGATLPETTHSNAVVMATSLPMVKNAIPVNNYSLEVKNEAKAMGYVNAHLDVFGDLAGEMNNHLDVPGPLSGTHPIFFAREVTSDATLNPSYEVIFEATQCITLGTGFHAKAGGEFTARIVEVCDDSGDNARILLNTHLGNQGE